MVKHMLRVTPTTASNSNYVKLRCERCPKNIVLPRTSIYDILVNRSQLLMHQTAEGRMMVKEWSQCHG